MKSKFSLRLKGSALQRSGQAWKVWILSIGTLISVVIIIGALWFQRSFPEKWFPVAMLIASFMILISFTFTAMAIRCPRCRARWYWLAISKGERSSWLDRLTLSICPICGYPGVELRPTQNQS